MRSGCVVAASWLPEEAPGEVLALFVEASRGGDAGGAAALPEACRAAVLGATGPRRRPRRGARAGHPPPHLLRQAPPGARRCASTSPGELTAPDPVTPLRLAGAMARSSLAYAKMRWERQEEG